MKRFGRVGNPSFVRLRKSCPLSVKLTPKANFRMVLHIPDCLLIGLTQLNLAYSVLCAGDKRAKRRMKALIRDRYGPPDVLEVREVERPVPKEREVLVRVHAASINDWDWGLLQRPMLPLRFLREALYPWSTQRSPACSICPNLGRWQ